MPPGFLASLEIPQGSSPASVKSLTKNVSHIYCGQGRTEEHERQKRSDQDHPRGTAILERHALSAAPGNQGPHLARAQGALRGDGPAPEGGRLPGVFRRRHPRRQHHDPRPGRAAAAGAGDRPLPGRTAGRHHRRKRGLVRRLLRRPPHRIRRAGPGPRFGISLRERPGRVPCPQ